MPLCLDDCYGVKDILAEVQARYEAKRAQEIEELRARVEANPIDDAAWQWELERRARVEEYLGIKVCRAP